MSARTLPEATFARTVLGSGPGLALAHGAGSSTAGTYGPNRESGPFRPRPRAGPDTAPSGRRGAGVVARAAVAPRPVTPPMSRCPGTFRR
ncbi:hypothetical protein GCM10010211_09560 [Streptomyces albospinus]|uniref:Uncharacterized protein n=1 Tax=Streptomyces albospinus TaxID=285515 RepID=A0ABQ2UR27_9ACTN|nr:hypothetical protein GCM10010211_09560 [Streptomyces albospinus]